MIKSKQLIFFVIFCAAVAGYFQTVRVDAPNFDLKLTRHTSIINNTAEYPYKYRLLNAHITHIYYTILQNILPVKSAFLLAYFMQNILIYGFLAIMVLKYFALWFDETGAVIGTLIMFLLIPLALTGYDTLGDITTAALMGLGFRCIITGKIMFLYPVIFIGAFNELQIILLVSFYFIGNSDNLKDKKVWFNAIALAGVFVLAYLIIYLIRGGQAGRDDYIWYFTKDAAFNIAHKDWIALWILMVSPFIYFVFKDFRSKPGFLRRNLLFNLPVFYFAAFFFMARLREIDKALTIFLVLIPLALFTLIPSHLKKSA